MMASILILFGLVLQFGEASQVAAESKPSLIVIGEAGDIECEGEVDIMFSFIIVLIMS